MKLPIEVWIAERDYSKNVTELFSEAVICYRNRAYRASLLLSYLGFLTIVKETLIRSKKPTDFTDTEWSAKIREIDTHDGWEKAVFNALIQGSSGGPAKQIYKLNPDIIQQFQYWRSRRNDAAHYNDNEIEGHHTDALWSFIKSNILKIVVNGGMEGLLNKFTEHHDDLKTPPDIDITPLIKEIPQSILRAELPEFIKQMSDRINAIIWYDDSAVREIYDKIFDLPDHDVIEALTKYMKEYKLDLKFINYFPHRIKLMQYDDHEKRELWKIRMFDIGLHINPFNIYSEILRENWVPQNEIQLVNHKLLDKFDQSVYNRLPENEGDRLTLMNCGFYDLIFSEAIIERKLKNYMWVNSKCDLIAAYIETSPLLDETVKVLCTMADSNNPSQWLIKKLNTTFESNRILKNNFLKKVNDLKITLPVSFI